MHSDTGADNSVIFILAHPDDEFAVFPWISRAVNSGRSLQLVWLTDGGWNGQDTARRQRESENVLGRMKVPRESMHFVGVEWSVPDGSLHLNVSKVLHRLRQKFEGIGPGATLYLPAWEGGHQDHDAAHLVGLKFGESIQAEMFQYPLYNGKDLPGSWFKVLAPIEANGETLVLRTTASERLAYIWRCFGFKSQWRSFLGLLPFYAVRMLKKDAFGVQRVNFARTSCPPHEGGLLYERRGALAWLDFAEATAQFRSVQNRN